MAAIMGEKVIGVFARNTLDSSGKDIGTRYFPSFFDTKNTSPFYRASAIITAPPAFFMVTLFLTASSLFYAFKSLSNLVSNRPQALKDIKESGTNLGLALLASLAIVTSSILNLVSFIGSLVVTAGDAINHKKYDLTTEQEPFKGASASLK